MYPSRPMTVLRRFALSLGLMRSAEFMIFLPAITLAGFWLGGEGVLLFLALGLPLLFILIGHGGAVLGQSRRPLGRADAIAALQAAVAESVTTQGQTACLILAIDDHRLLQDRHGALLYEAALDIARDRCLATLRGEDFVSDPIAGSFVMVLAPSRRLDLAALIQLASRLQDAIADPMRLGEGQIYLSSSIGFCLQSRAVAPGPEGVLEAAEAALEEAVLQGRGAIRAFSVDMAESRNRRLSLRADIAGGLALGEVRPYFQPQICTDTGEVAGVEALARWHHPKHGLLQPQDFLPLIEAGELGDPLSEVILRQALGGLRDWENAGVKVPTVSVNFSAAELRNPRLVARIKLELERHDLAPSRLTVEILETVVAQSASDVIVSNIAQLAELGCGVDLDDFGTGHASITSLRRFAIRRLKIDRSFVAKIDRDREQQRMVSAIISLADQLDLATVAEGVESPAEHALLAQLGCGYVQGYLFTKPLPAEAAKLWISAYQNRPNPITTLGLGR